MRISDIQLRDPFVVLEGGSYYLFGSTDKDIWKAKGTGFDVYVSGGSLCEFDGPFPAFRPPANFWSETNFWAAEVHQWRGSWYMFATFKPKSGRRGTAVLKSNEGIMGPYAPWSLNDDGASGPVTPSDWECLDGTFFVEDGNPYMVFSREWQQISDGQICAMRLTDDLRCRVRGNRRVEDTGEPFMLFTASEAPWSFALKNRAPGSFVTDGPYLYRAESRALYMLWSTMGREGNYCIGAASSQSGRLSGPWVQPEQPMFSADGGHGMIFKSREGILYLAIHSPNPTPFERPVFLEIEEKGNILTVRESDGELLCVK